MIFFIPGVFSEEVQRIGPFVCVLKPPLMLQLRHTAVCMLAGLVACGMIVVAASREHAGLQAAAILMPVCTVVALIVFVPLWLFTGRAASGRILIGVNGFAIYTPRRGEMVAVWDEVTFCRVETRSRSGDVPFIAACNISCVTRRWLRVTCEEFEQLGLLCEAIEEACGAPGAPFIRA